ncbi:Helicase ATP-binding domain-containing protein, partial [Trichostrongylus colubriformis]
MYSKKTDSSKDQPTPKIDKSCTCLPRTRVYYGTRTHKQIGQVVREFARLPYGGVISHTILASREQSCINQAARKSADVSGHCKELISSGGLGCQFKDAMKGKYERAISVRNVLQQMDAVVFDIEELVETLSSMPSPICPYFSSTRILTQDADLIFCPFSYLVDPIIRNSSDVFLKNSVVILDEAHNIEDNCREAASFTFFEKEIADALANLREKEKLALNLIEKCVTGADLMEGVEKEAINTTIENYTNDQKHITTLAVLVNDIFKWFRDSAKLLECSKPDRSGRRSQTVNHAHLDLDLKRFHLHPDNKARYEKVQAAFSGLISASRDGQENRDVEMKVSSTAIVCVEKWLYFVGFFKDEEKRSMYKMNVSSEPMNRFNEYSSVTHGEARWEGPKNVNYSQSDGADVWLS